MNSERYLRPLSVAVSAAVLCLVANLAQAQQSMAKMPAMSASAAGVADHGSAALSQSMMSGMAQMKDMKSSGDTDKDFAMMMKMHHQQALEMAQIELSHVL